MPRNSSWVKRCLRPFQHINGTDSRAGLFGNVLLGTCFYSFDALDTVDASGNTADAGWGWMPDHAINATKLWLRSNRASQQEQPGEYSDNELADQVQTKKRQAKKRKQMVASTADNCQVIHNH